MIFNGEKNKDRMDIYYRLVYNQHKSILVWAIGDQSMNNTKRLLLAVDTLAFQEIWYWSCWGFVSVATMLVESKQKSRLFNQRSKKIGRENQRSEKIGRESQFLQFMMIRWMKYDVFEASVSFYFGRFPKYDDRLRSISFFARAPLCIPKPASSSITFPRLEVKTPMPANNTTPKIAGTHGDGSSTTS